MISGRRLNRRLAGRPRDAYVVTERTMTDKGGADHNSARADAFAPYAARMRLTDADLVYVRDNYVTLPELCADRHETPEQVELLITQRLMPRPSYVLEDGTGYFPRDYFRLSDEAGGPDELHVSFAVRHRAATQQEQAADSLEQDWTMYLDGVWGVCLRDVTPETIVRKNTLVSSLCELLMLARPTSLEWRKALRAQVDELDALEREFSPDYDRGDEQERLPTRDLLITAARERYPELFSEAPTPA